jgi:protoheme IX farnesyltransferase
MLPVIAPPAKVAKEIVGYTWLTVAASMVLWPLATGWLYGVLAAAAGAVLIGAAHRLLYSTTRNTGAKPMAFFHLSNSYLAFVFVAVALDTFVR